MYTVRYAHLQSLPKLKIGQVLMYGDEIGIMGNTGASTGAHLHIDCVEGVQARRYTLADIEQDKPKSAPRQLNFFIDNDLFLCDPIITTWYCDWTYQQEFGKTHPAYDVVPKNKNKTKIFWNRSAQGEVIYLLDNDRAYGNCVHIAFGIAVGQKGR